MTLRRSSQALSVHARRAVFLAAQVFVCFVVLLASARANEAGGLPPDEPLNVLFVMSDQHNTRTMGCYGNGFGGVPQSLTPNLDQLASEGVKFQNAFCSTPQCTPSRYTILTGRWPHNHGLRFNNVWEPRDATTIAEVARNAGYATGTIGNHHMMWLDQSPPLTEDLGFDVILDMADYSQFCQAGNIPTFAAPGNFWEMPGIRVKSTGFSFNDNAHHPAGYWADQVIQFLDARAGPGGDGKPFVCWYSMYGPHTPVLPTGPADPQDWAHMYHPFDGLDLPPNLDKVATTMRLTNRQKTYMTEAQWREMLSYYYGFVTQIDWNIGRVLQHLETLGLADNTLVVYTADHGEMASEMSCWTKGTGSYDATNRVPLIARLPGILPAGKVVDELVSNVDLFPAIVELTGVPVSQAVRDEVDGRSLVDLMVGDGAATGWRQEVFSEFGHPAIKRHRMVRTATAKLCFDELGGDTEEFYDLTTDEFEVNDLIGDSSPVVQSQIEDLRERLDLWWNNERGHAPPYRVTGVPAAAPVQASRERPGNGSRNVRRDVNPSWMPCTAADTQAVYLGTSPGALTLVRTLTAMESSFNVGTLAPGTTYYWRVDQINGNGVRVGEPWSFTTNTGGNGGPRLSTVQSPLHRETGVSTGAQLSWSAGSVAATHDVYFGPENAIQLVASHLPAGTTTFDPGPLEAGVTYQWRVDPRAGGGTTEGDVWIFETDRAGLASRARTIYPAHMDENAAAVVSAGLSWEAGTGATSHDVYFGTSFPLDFKGNRTGSTYMPGPLDLGETYYWRVDEVNSSGTVRGWTWRFTAAPSLVAPRVR